MNRMALTHMQYVPTNRRVQVLRLLEHVHQLQHVQRLHGANDIRHRSELSYIPF